MDKKTLLNEWLHEQDIAHIKGWDFSHIRERYREEDGKASGEKNV